MVPTVEDFLSLPLPECKKKGYFRENSQTYGTITWKRNDTVLLVAQLTTTLFGRNPCAVLEYEGREQYVRLKFCQSNLPGSAGSSGHYSFICPVTGKGCRILYYDGTRFVGRDALGVPYRSDNRSKAQRARDRKKRAHMIF